MIPNRKKICLNIAVILFSVVIGYLFYYYISMDMINQFYPVSEENGLVLYLCHIVFFLVLLKVIFGIEITKVDKVLSSIMYFTILYMAMFDRFELAERKINLNPFQGFFDEGFIQMILNILVFIPFYSVLTWFLTLDKTKSLLLFIVFVFLIESYQYISMTGIFDVTDILLNLVGYFCGIKVYDVLFDNEKDR